jgi:hypothetical protein
MYQGAYDYLEIFKGNTPFVKTHCISKCCTKIDFISNIFMCQYLIVLMNQNILMYWDEASNNVPLDFL